MEKEEQKDQKDQKEKTTKRVLAGVGAAIALGAIIAIPTAIVLTRDQDVKITIDVGTSTPEVLKVKKGTLLSTIEQPVKEGYTFEGWYSSEDFLERLPDDTIIVENMTIYALMVPNEITFTYYVDNEPNTATVNNGTTIGQLESPTKEGGYEFVGWYLDENFENVADENTVITTSTELYAKFEQATVTLLNNDGITQYGETLLPDENGLVVLPTNTITTEIDDGEDEKGNPVTLYFQGWVEEGVDTTNSGFTIYKPYDEITLTSSMRLKAYYAEDDDFLTSYGISEMIATLNDDGTTWNIESIIALSDRVEIPVLYKGMIVTKLYSSNDNTSLSCFSETLTNIILPKSLTEIGAATFLGCSNLTNIIIPEGVTSIKLCAFDRCYQLVEVYNLSSLTMTVGDMNNGSVGYYAKVIHTSLDEESKITTINGINYYKETENEYIVIGLADNTIENLILDEHTTEINKYAFHVCTNLTSIDLSACTQLTSIGEYAFYRCTSLTSITIPESVTSIGGYAFSGCTNLSTITIDSETIANGLTSGTACGYIINYATTVYIKDDLDVSSSTYLTSNYTAQENSDVDGYIKYVKNS